MAKRTFEITFNDTLLDDKTQEHLQRALYIAAEEYLVHTGSRPDHVSFAELEASLNLRVLEIKWMKTNN